MKTQCQKQDDTIELIKKKSQIWTKQKNKNKKLELIQDGRLLENGPRLAIIRPSLINKEQNLLIKDLQTDYEEDLREDQIKNYNDLTNKILAALTQLSDNQQKNKMIKYFLSITTNYTKNERLKYLENVIQKDLINYIKSIKCINMLKQLSDSYKMQLEQSISNLLFFEPSVQEAEMKDNSKKNYNSAFLTSYLLYLCPFKSTIRQPQNTFRQRIIFLNLTGIINDDAEIHQQFKEECIYIQLQIQKITKNEQTNNARMDSFQTNFYTIYVNDNQGELTWKQFRIIYKFQIKNYIKYFKSNLLILSIAKELNNKTQSYINFSEDCLKTMVEKLSLLAKDKLIIHSYISQSAIMEPTQEKQQIQQLTAYLNSLQQGLLAQDILLKYENDEKNINWIQDQIKLNIKLLNTSQLEQIQRERRNQMINSNFIKEQDSSLFKFGIYILENEDQKKNNSSNLNIIYLFYQDKKDKEQFVQNKNLQFFTNTILYVDYEEKQIVLLQYENKNYFVYYTKFENIESNQLYCQRINLSEELQKQNIILDEFLIQNSSLILSAQKLYIVYNQDASKIFMINLKLQCPSVVQLERRNLNVNLNKIEDTKLNKRIQQQKQEEVQLLIQNRRKPTIVHHPCVSNFDFIVFGGEFRNSNQFCNLIELLKVESEGFSSVVIPKDILFQKCNYYIPWPNMIVLVNDQNPSSYILLPGDYKNKTFYYNQVINKEHQEKAILIRTFRDSLKFDIDYLKIIYSNDQNKKILPIQYFSGNQINIKHPKGLQQKWQLAITVLDNSSSNIMQLCIQAEIEKLVKEKVLSIKQSITQIECNLILYKEVINYERQSNISTKSNISNQITMNNEQTQNKNLYKQDFKKDLQSQLN